MLRCGAQSQPKPRQEDFKGVRALEKARTRESKQIVGRMYKQRKYVIANTQIQNCNSVTFPVSPKSMLLW